MPATDTRLGASHTALMSILRAAPDLRDGPELTEILELLRQRRVMDLSDLPPAEQAALIGARAQELLPSTGQLTDLLTAAGKEGRQLIVKFGIDPTAADVHVGHAVPMIIASRFQRIGHQPGDGMCCDPTNWRAEQHTSGHRNRSASPSDRPRAPSFSTMITCALIGQSRASAEEDDGRAGLHGE